MTIMQSVQILTDMARKPIPRTGERLRLAEWMTIRSVEPKEIAEAIDTTEASISRWCSGERTPRPRQMQALEEFFGADPGGLYQSPENAPDKALLAGLDKAQREDVLNYIAFIRSKK